MLIPCSMLPLGCTISRWYFWLRSTLKRLVYDTLTSMKYSTLISFQDPREYLPFLRELRALEKFYQRFRIDDHLKRYKSALRNLHLAGMLYRCNFLALYTHDTPQALSTSTT